MALNLVPEFPEEFDTRVSVSFNTCTHMATEPIISIIIAFSMQVSHCRN
jgi:hypothetical protein